MSNNHHLIHLNELLEEERSGLEVPFLAYVIGSRKEVTVIGFGQLDSGKKIRDDSLKERNVMGQKLEIPKIEIKILISI